MPLPRVRATVAAMTVVFALLCVVPYGIGAARTPSGARFTWLLYNDYDQEYYLASQRSAAEGLRPNRFSSEADAPGPIAPLYPLLGHLGDWTGLSPIALYHAVRLAAAAVLPLLVYVLMGVCFPGNFRRALEATALALFATGLGTLAPAIFSWRAGGDLVVVEATALRSATLLPHGVVAYAAIAACLIGTIVAVERGGTARSAAWGLVGGVLLAISHTFLLLPIGVTLAVWTGWSAVRFIRDRTELARLAGLVTVGVAMLLPSIPSLLALHREMARFEAIQGKAFQPTPSDHWMTWLAVYALLLPLAVAGVRAWRRDRNLPGLAVLTTALIVDFALVLTPFTPFQRRFSEGAVLSLAALAAYGLAALPRVRRPLFAVVMVMAALGASRLSTSATYLPASDWQVFDRIGRDDVVLAGDLLGSTIPAFSDGTVFVGRTVETMLYRTKSDLRASFARDPASAALAELRAAGVNLIVSDLNDPTFAVPPGRFPASCFQPAGAFGPLHLYRPLATCPAGPTVSR